MCFKFKMERDCQVLSQKNLSVYPELIEAFQNHVCNKDFPKISISDRLIGIKGKNYNPSTKFCWDFLGLDQVGLD